VRRSVSGRRASKSAAARRGRKVVRIRIPPEIVALKRSQPEEAARLQSEVRQEFEHWIGLGYAATGLEVNAGAGTYVLEPWARP
jgi:predicted GNAT superfamily acetyltransferase